MKPILVATDIAYWQQRRGNEIRIERLIRYLTKHFRVHVVYIGVSHPPHATEVKYHHLPPATLSAHLAAGLLKCLPERFFIRVIEWLNRRGYTRTLSYFRSEATLNAFRSLYSEVKPCVVLIEYIWYAFLIEVVDARKSLRIIDTHDVMHQRMKRYGEFGRIPDRSCSEAEELALLKNFDAILAIHKDDATYLRSRLDNNVLLVPHAEEVRPGFYEHHLATRTANDPIVLIYIGSASDQNKDAITWFIMNVWNEAMASRFRLNVWGGVCHQLNNLPTGVKVHGIITDVTNAYAQSDVAINPVRFGSGLKIKNVEALAFGVPVITTTIGAEGLAIGEAHGLLIADTPGDFHHQLETLTDPDIRSSFSSGALATIEKTFSGEACYGPLVHLIESPSLESQR